MLESIHARCRLPHKAYFGAGTRGPAGFGLGRRGRGFAHSERVCAGICRAAGVAAGGAVRATASIYPPSPPRGGVDMKRNLQCLWVVLVGICGGNGVRKQRRIKGKGPCYGARRGAEEGVDGGAARAAPGRAGRPLPAVCALRVGATGGGAAALGGRPVRLRAPPEYGAAARDAWAGVRGYPLVIALAAPRRARRRTGSSGRPRCPRPPPERRGW